jgi:hypothetical protein
VTLYLFALELVVGRDELVPDLLQLVDALLLGGGIFLLIVQLPGYAVEGRVVLGAGRPSELALEIVNLKRVLGQPLLDPLDARVNLRLAVSSTQV